MNSGLLLCALMGFAAAAPTYVELQLALGAVRGQVMTSNGTAVNRFLGVPFGADTAGGRRWQSPVAPSPWTAVKDTLKYGFTCPQHGNAFSATSQMSEDCLNLNLWIPQTGKSNYPVMLFFYGGSWDTGSAMFPLYGGDPLAHLTADTIIIAANYRLNVFGFLGSDQLRAADGSTGNFGLQDQRLAMQWIQDNAEAIGADPARVMIYGESAGSGSVACHLVSPKSWPLFTRAGMESGPVASWSAKSLADGEAQFDAFVTKLNCTGSGADLLKCMRAPDYKVLLDADHGLPGGKFTDWSPVVDGTELTDFPENLAQRGKMNPVPILLGSNKDEGTQLADIHGDADEAAYEKMLSGYYNGTVVQEVLNMYPATQFNDHDYGTSYFWAGSEVVTDYAMACAARRTARWQLKNTLDVYLYQFNHELEIVKLVEAIAQEPFGVFHGSELPFVFEDFNELLNKQEQELAHAFGFYWTAFAATGNPNLRLDGSTAQDAGLPTWPAYTAEQDQNIDLDLVVTVGSGLKATKCDFWDRLV